MLLKELNIPKKDWSKLLEIPAGDLLKLQGKLRSLAPVVDGYALPGHPFDPVAPQISKDKPLLVGWNEDEFTFFGMMSNDKSIFSVDFNGLSAKLQPQFGDDTQKIMDTYRKTRPDATAADILVAIMSINMMGLGSITIAERKTEQNGAPAYLYNLGYKSEVLIPGTDYPLGSPHVLDITFKFNNEQPQKDGSPGKSHWAGARPERFIASHNMAELWTSFARTGKPSAKGVPEWPAYDLKDCSTMRIDTRCRIIKDRYAEELKMWREIGRL
jgi:para-nitrobenzyl esterase